MLRAELTQRRRTPEAVPERKCSCGGTCHRCAAEREVAEAVARPGRPMEQSLRNEMESRFHFDFGQVRIHSDEEAGPRAATFGARAYTVGNHIVLGPRSVDLNAANGRRLIAHELAHVVQQRRSAAAFQPFRLSNPGDAAEREADAAAEAVASGSTVLPITQAPTGLSLQQDDGGVATPVPAPTSDAGAAGDEGAPADAGTAGFWHDLRCTISLKLCQTVCEGYLWGTAKRKHCDCLCMNEYCRCSGQCEEQLC